MLALLMAQGSETLAVIDLWSTEIAPDLGGDCNDIILKCVVSSTVPLHVQIERFRPDRTVLVLRNPYHNFLSLVRKEYSHEAGTVEEKFALLERTYQNTAFDAVWLFEDLLVTPHRVLQGARRLGLDLPDSALEYRRTTDDILQFNVKRSAWCRESFGTKWGFGNIHGRGIVENRDHYLTRLLKRIDPEVRERVRSWCPGVCELYSRWPPFWDVRAGWELLRTRGRLAAWRTKNTVRRLLSQGS
ncbi:MAG TPA: hypothetical protein VNB06_13050 [Thermoanaerobaculia bacterium]|nr:hypothetical protein [Thermoanaerobaculia bacterium]